MNNPFKKARGSVRMISEYEQWDKLSVLSAEIREAIEQDFSEDSLQALRNRFFEETETLKKILEK